MIDIVSKKIINWGFALLTIILAVCIKFNVEATETKIAETQNTILPIEEINYLIEEPVTFLALDYQEEEKRKEKEISIDIPTILISEEEVLVFDVTTKQNFPYECLESILREREIATYLPLFIDAADQNEINIVFLLSLGIWESGWGETPNSFGNLFGWEGSPSSSIEESIYSIAALIRKHYLNEDGKYYSGTTIPAINEHYNTRQEWEDGMVRIMLQLYEQIDIYQKMEYNNSVESEVM